MSEVPESLKFLQNYLLRAKEVETKDPIISYYCRFYAAKAAIEKIQNGTAKNKDAEVFVLGLMDQLDKVFNLLSLPCYLRMYNRYRYVDKLISTVTLHMNRTNRRWQRTRPSRMKLLDMLTSRTLLLKYS